MEIRKLIHYSLLIIFGFTIALAGSELALALLKLPPEPLKRHSSPPQFRFVPGAKFGYVNKPSTNIPFIYDGDPRGYFESDNEVNHRTNALGFRGYAFSREHDDKTYRIIFLGDSFTFGEGVHFQDTYPETVRSLLDKQTPGKQVETQNFGVGGFNTRQEADLLHTLAIQSSPDLVVLGYTLNDAEPPLFTYNPNTKKYERRARHLLLRESGATKGPPDNAIYKLRLAQLFWHAYNSRKQTQNTIKYYKSLYMDGAPAWAVTTKALKEIGDLCASNGIPCIGVIFPVLHNLDDYPLVNIHNHVGKIMEESGFIVVDLLQYLHGWKGPELWVHPTDQHPNELVHKIAAEEVVEVIKQNNLPVTAQ
jgi:hypothetical protein